MVQTNRSVPFSTRIRVTVRNRGTRNHSPTAIEDGWLAVRLVGVTLVDAAARIGDCVDAVLLIAVVVVDCSAAAGSLANYRFVDVATIDVSIERRTWCVSQAVVNQ